MSLPVENSGLDEVVSNHPISLQNNGATPASVDVDFIIAELESVGQHLIIADEKRRHECEELKGNWVGKNPILRMIHCLIDFDDIKYSFIH